jgi:hypothetical protein
MYQEEHHSKAKTIWLVIIILFIGISNTVWGLLYFTQQSDQKQMSDQLSSLSAKNTTLNSQISDLKSKLQNTTANVNDASTWREIPELGVKFKKTSNNQDITYMYASSKDGDTEVDSILLSTTSLVQNASSDDSGRSTCSSNDGPAGAITKYKAGTFLPVAGTKVDEVKDAVKIGSYYLIFEKPQAACDNKIQQEQDSALKNAYATFKTLQPLE